MASVASQLIVEVTAHAQSDSLDNAREICADGTYFPNNLRTFRSKFCLRFTGITDITQTVNSAHINFWVVTPRRPPTFSMSVVPVSQRDLVSLSNCLGAQWY